MKFKVRAVLKGGPGSGHYGHAGRPGEVGGSAPSSAAKGWGERTFKERQQAVRAAVRGRGTKLLPSDIGSFSSGFIHPSGVLIQTYEVHEDYANTVLRKAGSDRSYEYNALVEFLSYGYIRVSQGHNHTAIHIVDPDNLTRSAIESLESVAYLSAVRERNFSWEIGSTDGRTYKFNSGYTSLFQELGISKSMKEIELQIEVFKQLPIDDAAKRKLFDVRLNIFYDSSDVLAEQVFTGALDIGSWEVEMRSLIKEMYTSASAIGKGGWDAMSFQDWGRLGTPVREQYKYLKGFAADIAERADDVTLSYIRARARMYGNSAGYVAELMQASEDLLQYLPWLPKDGSTECLVNCKCFWELKVIATKKTFKTVRATWRLRPAEHCTDCVDRNGHVETFNVHKDTPVPPILGGF